MNLQIGNREKVAALVIGCLVTLGAVHYLLFMSRAQAYRSAFLGYAGLRGRYQSMIGSGQEREIREFISANESMETTVTQLAKDLNVQWDPLYFPELGNEAVQKRQKRLLELIDQIADLRKTHGTSMTLAFLDFNNGEGWDIPAQLPPITPDKMWDIIERLKDFARLIRVTANPFQRDGLRQQYNNELLALGINPINLQVIERHGRLVPQIKRLAHARLIWARKQDSDKSGASRVPIESIQDVYDLLEVRLPKNPIILFHDIKQLEFLLKVIDLAAKRKVEEVRLVQLFPVRKVDQIPNPKGLGFFLVPEIHYEQQTAMGGVMYGPPGMLRRTPMGSMYAPQGPTGAMPTPVEPGMGMGPGVSITTEAEAEIDPDVTPEPLPVGDYIGNTTPIRIQFRALWETALGFLYDLNHNHNPFEQDSWRMTAIMGEGGKVQTDTILVPMAWVEGIRALYAPPTTAPLTAAMPGPGMGPGVPGAPIPPGPGTAAPGAPRPTAPRGSLGLD